MSRKIRAKMKCNSVTKTEGSEQVKLAPVTAGNNPDNASWSKWTPSGVLELNITNPDVHGAFEPGKEYFVEITAAE